MGDSTPQPVQGGRTVTAAPLPPPVLRRPLSAPQLNVSQAHQSESGVQAQRAAPVGASSLAEATRAGQEGVPPLPLANRLPPCTLRLARRAASSRAAASLASSSPPALSAAKAASTGATPGLTASASFPPSVTSSGASEPASARQQETGVPKTAKQSAELEKLESDLQTARAVWAARVQSNRSLKP